MLLVGHLNIQQVGAVVSQHFFQRQVQFRLFFDVTGAPAKALGDLYKVGVPFRGT